MTRKKPDEISGSHHSLGRISRNVSCEQLEPSYSLENLPWLKLPLNTPDFYIFKILFTLLWDEILKM